MVGVEKMPLIVDDSSIKKTYLSKMYFLLGLHFTLISAAAFCLFMTPGVRPFVQQHAFLVPIFILATMVVFAINKFLSDSFSFSLICIILLTVSMSLSFSVVSLYIDTENGYLICGMVAIAWFCHWLIGCFSLIRINLPIALILTPFFLIAGSLFLIETIGLFSFDIFINAPTSFIIMLYIIIILHRNVDDYTEDTLIGFRRIYPDVYCIRKA